MVKFVKRGGIAVGVGVLVGAAVVGWMKLHPADDAVANAGGKPVVLDTSTTPMPTPTPGGLIVVDPGEVAKNGGGAQSLLGGSNVGGSGSGGSTAGSGPSPSANSWPGPDKFGQYDQYKDKKAALFGDQVVGTGAAVAVGSVVTVNYRGWLTDGRLFDESYTGGKPFAFTEGANKVITGWEQGLFGMKVGGRRRLIIPPSVGYGASGHDPIPPNAVLIFDVELVEVK